MLALLLATLAIAAPDEGPTFEARGASAVAAIPEDLIADLSAVLGARAPEGMPLTITASRRLPSLRLLDVLTPPFIGEEPPSQEREFLLAFSSLVPAGQLDSKTAARVADARFAAARAAWPDLAEASRWMASAIPMLRVAATRPGRRPDRLALRAAWAARLAGDKADLAWAAGLLRGAPDTAEAAEAHLLLADAWMQPRTWDNEAALAAAQAAADARDAPLAAGYALGWAWYGVGDHQRAIERLRQMVGASQQVWPANDELVNAALRDLIWMFADAGIIDDGSGCWRPARRPEQMAPLYRRLAIAYLEQGKVEMAVQLVRRMASEGTLRDQDLDALVLAASHADPAARLEALRHLLPTMEAATGFEERRPAVAATLAQAAAELHYRQIGTPALDRAQLAWAYTESLRLHPRTPHAEAINRLLDSL